MYTHIYETRYGDFKDFETLKYSSLLDTIQDVAIKDSEMKGYGIYALRDMHMAWLLLGIRVKFDMPLSTRYPLEVSTAVKKMKGATSERGCIIKQNGKTVARSIANWFLFDSEKERICKIPLEMSQSYEPYDFEDEFFTYIKPETHEADEVAYTITVGNKEIDTNKHLNNQKSAELLMDALPYDFEMDEMRVLYKTPAYLGDTLEVCRIKTDKGYYVHLQTTDKNICVAGEFVSK